MTTTKKREIKVNTKFVLGLNILHKEVTGQFYSSRGFTAAKAWQLAGNISRLNDQFRELIERVKVTPPEIGSEVEVYFVFLGESVKGTVLGGDSYAIKVRISKVFDRVTPNLVIKAEWDDDRWTCGSDLCDLGPLKCRR